MVKGQLFFFCSFNTVHSAQVIAKWAFGQLVPFSQKVGFGGDFFHLFSFLNNAVPGDSSSLSG